MSHIKVNKFYVRTAYFFGGGDFLWRGALGEREGGVFFLFSSSSFFLLSVSFSFCLCFLLCLLVWLALFDLACMAFVSVLTVSSLLVFRKASSIAFIAAASRFSLCFSNILRSNVEKYKVRGKKASGRSSF